MELYDESTPYEGATYDESYATANQPDEGTWIQCFDEESGYPYVYNNVTGETKWIDAESSNDLMVTLWQKFYDDSGDAFYYNPHTGESTWELPSNAVLEEDTEQHQQQTQDHNEDIQFADNEFDNVDYDGNKYIEMYSPAAHNRHSLTEGGTDGIFDISHEPSVDQTPNANQLAQASIHSSRSTKSQSYIPMRHLVKKGSKDGMLEKKTSFGSLAMSEKKHTAQSLGIKTGSSFLLNRTPVVRDSLKPATPSQSEKTKLSGFALLKVGASVIRRQIDETGTTWLEYQAADNGPVFYAQENGTLAGQWNRPTIFDLEDFSSASVVSVEPVDFGALDEALISRPSSRKDLRASSGKDFNAALTNEIAKVDTKAAASGAYKPKVKTVTQPVEEPKTEERKSLFGSFINSVFVETVAKEDQVHAIDANMTLDALFGLEDDEERVEESSTKVSQKEVPSTPTPSAGEALFTPPPLSVSVLGDSFTGGVDALESPAERIALTPVRKLPPGSGMRKASFSQLDYIPESQPLFEKDGSTVLEPVVSTSTTPVEKGEAAPVVGEGLAAVRAMYATTSTSAAGPSTVPFVQSATTDTKALSTPKVDLLGTLEAESPRTPSVKVTAGTAGDVWVQCYDEESGWPYVYNEATGEVKWVEPESTEQLMAVMWDICYDEDGNEFYYNQATSESRWDLPENAKVADRQMGANASGVLASVPEVSTAPGTPAPAHTATAANSTVTASTPAAMIPAVTAGADTAGSPAFVSMKGLTKKASLQSMIEKKTSVGNLTPLAKKQSAAELGILSGSAWIRSKPPEIKNELKPTVGTPKVGKSSLSGFALLKVGAKVLDKQIDDEGAVWVKYQAVDKGPVFYAQEGAESAGQWHRPAVYLDDIDEDHSEEDLLADMSLDDLEAVVEPKAAKKTPAPGPDKSTSPAPTKENSTAAAKQKETTKEVAVAGTEKQISPVSVAINNEVPEPPVESVKLQQERAAVIDPPVASPSTVPKTMVPALPLEPIITKQLTTLPAVQKINAAVSAAHTDSQDVGLYELSGLSVNKDSMDHDGGALADSLSAHQSLAQELKNLGIDDDDEQPNKRTQKSPSPTSKSKAASNSKGEATKLSAAEQRKANVEAKLQEYRSIPLESRLVDSPYKAKSTEKYPIKVKNVLSKEQPIKAVDPQPVASPGKAAHAAPDVSDSPSRSRHKTGKIAVKSASSASPRSPGEAAPGGTFFSSHFARDTSLASGPASSFEELESPYRMQNLPEYGSPVVGGAVKSSFLTELGLTSAEPSALDEAYKPPRGVSKDRLVEEFNRGEKLDVTLRQLVSCDANDEEAQILLQRLQKIADCGLTTNVAQVSRPTAAPQDGSNYRDLHAESRKIIERTCVLLERIEVSAIEHEVNEKQLLEVMLRQRGHLVPPRSLVRDHKTHNSLPVHCCSPQGVKLAQVEHKLEIVADAGAWLLCKDPFFLNGQFFYVNKATRFVQFGEPFDFQMKKMRKDLHKENWNEFDLNLAVNQHCLENVNAELLRDPHGGLLVYSSTDDQYSSTGKFDVNLAARSRLSSSLSNTQLNNTAPMSGGMLSASLNLKSAALLHQANVPQFTHQRPSSASATMRNTSHNPAVLAAQAGGTYSRAGSDNIKDKLMRRNLPKNVWSTFQLDQPDSPSMRELERATSNFNNTSEYNFTSDFGNLMDQTAVSWDDGNINNGQPDNFQTLKNAFSSNNVEDIMQDGHREFSSPYFDTEMMLEFNKTKEQNDPGRMLRFESSMDPEVYQQYQRKILDAAAEPENPVPLLELMELLIYEGLGKQALAVFKRALTVLDAVSDWSLSPHELAMCRILSIKMSEKYYRCFEKPTTIYAVVDSFPESPLVLTHAALYFHQTKYIEQAELLYIGALMLNPGYDHALVGYARLLAEKRNFRAALRYLGRVEEDSPMWLSAKLDMAGITEITGVDSAALVVAYKNCTYSQTLQRDRAYACALHCMAFHHERLNEHDKATFFYGRALVNNPEDSLALLLSAAAAVMTLPRHEALPIAPAMVPKSRPSTAGAAGRGIADALASVPATPFSKEQIDAKYRSGVFLTPKYRYRWIATLGYADFIACEMRDTHRAEQYYVQASKLSFSYSIWSTLALAHFHQYVRGEAGVAGRLLLRTLRHRHADVSIDCLTDFNAFKHREVDQDPVKNIIKFMSLPTPQDTAGTFKETTDDSEVAALYVVIAFYLMDLQEWEDAMKYAAAAIRINETYSPALRCIALITWQHGNTRRVSLRYFSAAEEFAAGNPYVLRTCSVVKALEGQQAESITLMEAAVQAGPNSPLALRALGLMMYLFRKDDAAALDLLSRSFFLSKGEDIECLRLKGQMLMDQGRFKEARAVLQQALYIVPWDPVSLAALGYCVGMLPHQEARSMSGGSTASYQSRLMSMQSFDDLIHSRDPEELFEAAVTVDLPRIFANQANLSTTGSEQYARQKSKRAVNPFSQSNAMVLSNFAVENELDEVDTDFGNNMTGYAYFWYGMYELRKTKYVNVEKARTLFNLASKVAAPGAASSSNALAMYMLGVLAEREEDIAGAERHYLHAVQCEPMEPIALLRLAGLIEDGLANIKRLIRLFEKAGKRKSKKKSKGKRRSKAPLDSTATVNTYRPPAPHGGGNNTSLFDNLTDLLSKPLLGADDEDGADTDNDGAEATDLGASDALADYQRRLLLHQRIHEMIVLKKQSYRKLLGKSVVYNPSHHVFVDSYWLERLLHSFSTCEDWAQLHKSAQTKPTRKVSQNNKHK